MTAINIWIITALKTFVKPIIKAYSKQVESNIPIVALSEKHIKNTRMLVNRSQLLDLLPKDAVVAEIGVDNGDFSKKISSICVPKKLHLIDAWDSSRYNQIKKNSVKDYFSGSSNVQIHIGLSTDVVNQFEDNYFDWIYIDTDHSYVNTSNELKLYSKKIKRGGIIAGHDFTIGNWNNLTRYGVQEAVYEFCVEHQWELIYTTAELNCSLTKPSFAIRKL